MRFSFNEKFAAALLSFVLFTGCGIHKTEVAKFGGTQPGLLTPEQAAQSEYHYALSAQVKNATTGEVLKDFAVSLVGGDQTSTVVNALGALDGLFHISRKPAATDAATTNVPAVITAPGFEPLLKALTLSTDCQTADCKGAQPLTLLLKPLVAAVTGTATATAATGDVDTTATAIGDALTAKAVTDLLGSSGAPALFANLLGQGKLDTTLATLLAKSNNKDLLSNVLVMLNPSSSSQATNLVSTLLGSVGTDKTKGLTDVLGIAAKLIPLLAATNPQMGGAILAVNVLLPYLAPLLNQGGTAAANPFSQILATFLGGTGTQGNLLNLANLLQGKAGSTPQLALASFLPLLQGFLKQGTVSGSTDPLANLVNGFLQNPSGLAGLLGGLGKKNTADASMTMLFTYLQPLLQGLGGKNATDLSALFNDLMKNGGGLAGLKTLASNPALKGQYAALLPFIEPLMRGLNSKDGASLATLLAPLAGNSNPAALLQGLLTNGKANKANFLQIAATVFPALSTVLSQVVPGKQVLGAQILQGLVNGDFKNLQITKDMTGSPAVLVSGTAQDIFKLAQLQNVAKVLLPGSAQ